MSSAASSSTGARSTGSTLATAASTAVASVVASARSPSRIASRVARSIATRSPTVVRLRVARPRRSSSAISARPSSTGADFDGRANRAVASTRSTRAWPPHTAIAAAIRRAPGDAVSSVRRRSSTTPAVARADQSTASGSASPAIEWTSSITVSGMPSLVPRSAVIHGRGGLVPSMDSASAPTPSTSSTGEGHTSRSLRLPPSNDRSTIAIVRRSPGARARAAIASAARGSSASSITTRDGALRARRATRSIQCFSELFVQPVDEVSTPSVAAIASRSPVSGGTLDRPRATSASSRRRSAASTRRRAPEPGGPTTTITPPGAASDSASAAIHDPAPGHDVAGGGVPIAGRARRAGGDVVGPSACATWSSSSSTADADAGRASGSRASKRPIRSARGPGSFGSAGGAIAVVIRWTSSPRLAASNGGWPAISRNAVAPSP